MAWQAVARISGMFGVTLWKMAHLYTGGFIFTIYWEYIIIPTDELIFFRGIETINQYIVDLMGLNEVLHGHQTWLEIHGNPRTKWDDMTHPTVR